MSTGMHDTGHEADQLFIALAATYVRVRAYSSQVALSRACEQCGVRMVVRNSDSLEVPKRGQDPSKLACSRLFAFTMCLPAYPK